MTKTSILSFEFGLRTDQIISPLFLLSHKLVYILSTQYSKPDKCIVHCVITQTEQSYDTRPIYYY